MPDRASHNTGDTRAGSGRLPRELVPASPQPGVPPALASMISLGGDWFLFVAVASLVLEATDSAVLVGMTILSQELRCSSPLRSGASWPTASTGNV